MSKSIKITDIAYKTLKKIATKEMRTLTAVSTLAIMNYWLIQIPAENDKTIKTK